ncbi:hypothetical protein VTI28DRAFT_10327 [Corynascus sepedonium]
MHDLGFGLVRDRRLAGVIRAPPLLSRRAQDKDADRDAELRPLQAKPLARLSLAPSLARSVFGPLLACSIANRFH